MSDKTTVYSAVAVPGEPDSDGEILTQEEIRYAAHAYLKDYRIVDPEHVCALGTCREVGNPVESYLTTSPMSVKSYDGTTLELPTGTWVIGIDVFDDDTYSQIQKGEKRGVSLTAKRADGVIKSRVLIRDLGPDWVARTVSIVKNPAVPKARFFRSEELVSMNEEVIKEEVTPSGIDRIVDAIKSLRQPVAEEKEETVMETATEEEAEDVVKSEEEVQESDPSFVTHDELDTWKTEILEAVKSILPQEEAIKEDDAEEEEEAEDEKDKRIKELEAENQRLKTATKSKGIPDHLQTEQKEAVKNLYTDDGRDLYGRVIRD